MGSIEALESRRHFAAGSLAGSVDTSYGQPPTVNGNTIVSTNNHSYTSQAQDYAVDDSGRLVLAAFYTDHHQIGLSRLDVTGRKDFTFGNSGGFVTLPRPTAIDSGSGTKIATDHAGRVLVLHDNMLTRLNNKGRIDTTFGAGGSVSLPVFSEAANLTVDARNRPIIVGTSSGTTGARATVLRVGVAGLLDSSFGTGGAFKTPVPQDSVFKHPGNATGVGIELLSNGQIVAADQLRYRYDNENSRDNVNATQTFRLNADGSLDTTYGSSGYAQASRSDDDVNNGSARFNTFLPDGGTIITNSESSFDSPTFVGGVNWSFIDQNGVLRKDGFSLVPSGLAQPPSRFDVTVAGVQADGKLVLSTPTTVYRLNANFKLDTTFSPPPLTAETVLPNGFGDLLLISRDRDGGNALIGSQFSVVAVLA